MATCGHVSVNETGPVRHTTCTEQDNEFLYGSICDVRDPLSAR